MLERATWAKMEEVHKVDKETAKRAGQIASEIERLENRQGRIAALKDMEDDGGHILRAMVIDCTFEDRQDVVCGINLDPGELNAVIEYENRAIESLENELEGM